MMILTFFIFLSCFLLTTECNEIRDFLNSLNDKDVIENLNTMQIIKKFGYPAEAHEVVTKDGYLLQMHRIPHGKYLNISYSKQKPPVLIQHGLLGSSASLLLGGPKIGLPFLLSDLGYDIWLGNARGNVYSRAHVSLTPDDARFWNFTWHETGIYDLPAEIDFIRKHTKQDKIIFIGFSMGTTSFFVLNSVLPQYNDKILVSHLMAPIGYLKHVKSPLIQIMSYFALGNKIKELSDIFLHGEFLPESPALKIFIRTFCEVFKIQMSLCFNIVFLMVGFDPDQLDTTLRRRLLSHFPAGYSGKGVFHYGQLRVSGKFGQYDYGAEKNELIYGFPEPPEYKVENIRAPLYFYVGKNDYLSTLRDVDNLKKRLKSLKSEYIIEYPKFTHLDFIVSLDVKKNVYDKLIYDLTKFIKNQKASKLKYDNIK